MPQKTKNTPMMQQYLDIKEQYPDAFLFYRVGDFYELFYEDAKKAAKLLELTLTARNKNADDSIPMCGVPHHAVQNYIDILVEKGYKVAICDQVEDPRLATGTVKREVTQLITPGTATDTVDAKENNYLVAIIEKSSNYGLAYVDSMTGELKVTHLEDEMDVINECSNLQTKEIVYQKALPQSLIQSLQQRLNVIFSLQEDIENQSDISFLLEPIQNDLERETVQLLLSYLLRTQKRQLSHVQQAESYRISQYLEMDYFSKFNLELMKSIRTGKREGTLLWLLDETKTAMGGRLLKQWIERPLVKKDAILLRQRRVASLVNAFFERQELQEALKTVYDLERLVGRVSFGTVNARELIQLKTSLQQIPQLIHILSSIDAGEWRDMLQSFHSFDDLVSLIEQSIREDAPLSITEGGIIKEGYDKQLDHYLDAMRNGKQWLADLEAKERLETGIKNLKIGYNRVFGYYIEISKSALAQLPDGRYERKQTLANVERFITPDLKKIENEIQEAEEKSQELEYQLFANVREEVKSYIISLQQAAKQIAEIDVLQGFAEISERYHYVCPTLNDDHQLKIIEGRHPVVEKVVGSDTYVPNDVIMDNNTEILLITGPNMSGKSTYMRQLALLVIMTQIGCFVSAKQAEMPIFDHIFTRIGASDDLISGQSTFMVEMMEANQALRNATPNSLIIFDEIGRGTATYDGIALAQSIVEYIHQNVHAKTLFSTHYHELTSLEQHLGHLQNWHVDAVEEDGNVIFLHKMTKGPADKSYGIHVAKLAGLPDSLLDRAQTILQQLEQNESHSDIVVNKKSDLLEEQIINTISEGDTVQQMSLFDCSKEQEIVEYVKQMNLMSMTPMDAMNELYRLQQKLL